MTARVRSTGRRSARGVAIRAIAVLLVAALAACGTPATAPDPQEAESPKSSPRSEDAVPRDEGVRDVFVLPSAPAGRLDRIVRLDSTLSARSAVPVSGSESYGGLGAGGSSLVLLVPRTADGERRPSLVLWDADSLASLGLGGVEPDLVPGVHDRPRAPFLVGPDAPHLVVVPLRTQDPAGATIHDAKFRVVDTAKRVWFDVPAPPDAERGALFAAADGSAHIAAATSSFEVFDVDVARRRVRTVTRGPALPSPRKDAAGTGLRGFAVRGGDGDVFVANRNGEVVRVALADGAATRATLPVAGLGEEAFVEDVAWSAASRQFAVVVLRRGDRGNWPAHVVVLDGDLNPTGIEIATPSSVQQAVFSPGGGEIVLLLVDGSLRRHRVKDGALLATSAAGFVADAILGVR